MNCVRCVMVLLLVDCLTAASMLCAEDLQSAAAKAMRTAAQFYRQNAASHGGYVYHYSLDMKRRWGEGEATSDQIWVQPPGTPTVGMAFLKAYQATRDPFYLKAAQEAAEALAYGQLESGGWTNCVDFDPKGKRSAQYRNGKGRGKNNSSLDDGQTQSALRFLIQADEALNQEHKSIHEAAMLGLDALLNAQFPNGGFPQVWTGPVEPREVMKAGYPDHDWRTEGRIKEYWTMYTLNDDVCGYVAETLIEADRVYRHPRYTAALRRLGDFLILAQMPDPQPGWAQQYNTKMQPIWARRFEPPGVSGDETQEAIETLLRIYSVTGDRRYLTPIPRALAWLKKSRLDDGRLARYYELRTNRPLYMSRRGRDYSLTYDDSNLPSHYGWKTPSRIDQLERQYSLWSHDKGRSQSFAQQSVRDDVEALVRKRIDELDDQGRWVTRFNGERLVGQLQLPVGTPYLSSAVFSSNLETLAEFLVLSQYGK